MTILTFKNFLSTSSRHSIELAELVKKGVLKSEGDYVQQLFDRLKVDFDIIPIAKDDPQDDSGFVEVELPIETQP